MSVFAADFGTGEVFWSFLWFFMFFIWIWLLVIFFTDIFRSHDLSGWAKALWVIFIVVLPFLGILVYLITRGHKMQEHALEAAKQQDDAMRQYVQQAAGSAPSTADELAKLADLKAKGVISDEEYTALKAKALA